MLTYWLIAGTVMNGYVLKRDREIGMGLIAINMTLGPIVLPFVLGVGALLWLEENAKIKI